MIVYVILHDLCMEQNYDTRMNWALNTIMYAYADMLSREDATGIALLDRDNGRYDHLEHLFQNGLQFPGGRNFYLDHRIKLFGMTSDNASHISSAADVPTEYGGVGGDYRRLNPAMLRGSTAQRAQDMRREAIRTADQMPRPGHERTSNPR